MTCCVLSGFAKKKKYVGTIYACDGSDLPATQDFGTVQYQGPFESAQTVPSTTVTYTIIGKTQCGDDIRRITTKTYSSRSVANQFKYTVTLINQGYGADVADTTPSWSAGIVTGYGSTEALAFAACGENSVLLHPSLPVNWQGVKYPPYKYTLTSSLATNRIELSGYELPSGEGAYSITYSNSATYGGAYSSTQLTTYYLDIHEVWTYDLV